MEQEINAIRFHYVDVSFSFPERTKLKRFLLNRFKEEGRTVEAINYVFCTDEYLLNMNERYLKHSTLTDIITFELSASGQPIVADIFISVERVKENASTFRVSFLSELKRVIFHGSLHLSGYKDKKELEIKRMREKEEEYLQSYKSFT